MLGLSIKRITEDLESYIELLMEADPEESMIRSYLFQSELYGAFFEGKTVGIVAVSYVNDCCCEIKNISVISEFQRKGIGREIIEYLTEEFSKKYDYIIVGTAKCSRAPIKFYENCGFVYTHTLKNYFIDNYSEPIFDNGILCIDMIYFKKVFKKNLL